MHSTSGPSLLALAAAAFFSAAPVAAQTTTKCNPLTQTCPSDPALGTTLSVDFTKGIPNLFTSQGNPTTDGNGLSLSVKASGDSPTIVSTFYIMFGNVEVTMKAASGQGIVSSIVLQSDDLDEIDWEWLGGDDTQVQSNYFGKGKTDFYDRGAFHSDPGNHDNFITYTLDWTADAINWQIGGNTVRTLTPQTAHTGEYPQTPMQIKLGSWSGGDPANAPGTIEWAGGPTNYAACPCTMIVKSLKVTDYSTGKSYSYSGTDGTWESITSSGGKVNPQGSGDPPSTTAAAAPSGSSGPTVPAFDQSRGTSSTPTSSYPTSYSGLPSGWTVSSSGKSAQTSSSTSQSASVSGSASGSASGSIAPSIEGASAAPLTSLKTTTGSTTGASSATAAPFSAGTILSFTTSSLLAGVIFAITWTL